MYLLLRNFAKISNAKIKIDGITVIGGKNNSGKTTIGKTLFAYYNSFYKRHLVQNQLIAYNQQLDGRLDTFRI